MKTAKWRVCSLVQSLALLLLGTTVVVGVSFLHFHSSMSISINAVTILFVAMFTLFPILMGTFLLLQLCEETEEDCRERKECERLMEELGADIKSE